MKICITVLFVLVLCELACAAPRNKVLSETLELRISSEVPHVVEVLAAGKVLLRSPKEGLWSIATDWKNGWLAPWSNVHPERVERLDDWTVLHGTLETPGGLLGLRDTYRVDGNRIRVVRRFSWQGAETLKRCTLSVRWIAPDSRGALPLLPGISYYGNPSGARRPGRVPVQTGAAGELSLYEEHRYPMPFACIEWSTGEKMYGAALHTLPSRVEGGHYADQWWSLGLRSNEEDTELLALSGPCATNNRKNVVKALQNALMDYPDAWMSLQPGAVIEKTFFLQVQPIERKGSAHELPLRTALDIHAPCSLTGLPRYETILREKLRFAKSRFRDLEKPGFEMYPEHVAGTHFVMGWCGQAAAPGYALQVLANRFGEPDLLQLATRSLNTLSEAPFNEHGFMVRFDPETGTWQGQDPVSQGQAMENFARAIEFARHVSGVDSTRWERFLEQACRVHAKRFLSDDWHPLSTNEAFIVSPLLRGARLFNEEPFRLAAMKAVEHYAERHLDMREPYWGGTLDASCEDKEGAWAAFQAFLAAYECSGTQQHLRWAEHAMNVFLSYVVVWDIDMPAGRLRDHNFCSRGWTVVSPQNQHLDVFAVVATPEIYKMGRHLGRPDLKRLAAVMYRSCGQLIDPFGSQGEQIQHTNFAQHGDMSEVLRLRGGYSEGWTVFWITAHFLSAAARFEELGVDLDVMEDEQFDVDTAAGPRMASKPLYRDPVHDGAADPVIMWNRNRAAWWMLYTQRRASLDLPGVEWAHGTEIGVAESPDLGRSWNYLGTLPLEARDEHYSFWAPDVIEVDGLYHMFVSYVPGMHSDWSGERHMLHYASRDLWNWTFRKRIDLGSDRCIDATLFRMPGGAWRMWYKDEAQSSMTLAVQSEDLQDWKVVADPGVSRLYGEGPKVFRFHGCYWMIKDPDSGLDVYRSEDLDEWEYQGKILADGGRFNDDRTIGKHPDVVVCGDKAFIFYFTHPDGQDHPARNGIMPYAARRSSIHCAELAVIDGKLVCDRNKPFSLRMPPPE